MSQTPAVDANLIEQHRCALRAPRPHWWWRRRPTFAPAGVRWTTQKRDRGFRFWKTTTTEVPLPPLWGGPACDDDGAAVRHAGLLSVRAWHTEREGRLDVFVALTAVLVALVVGISQVDPGAPGCIWLPPFDGQRCWSDDRDPILWVLGGVAVVILLTALRGNRRAKDAGWLRALAAAWDQEAARLAAVAQNKDEVAQREAAAQRRRGGRRRRPRRA